MKRIHRNNFLKAWELENEIRNSIGTYSEKNISERCFFKREGMDLLQEILFTILFPRIGYALFENTISNSEWYEKD